MMSNLLHDGQQNRTTQNSGDTSAQFPHQGNTVCPSFRLSSRLPTSVVLAVFLNTFFPSFSRWLRRKAVSWIHHPKGSKQDLTKNGPSVASPGEDVLQRQDPWKGWQGTKPVVPNHLPNAADSMSQLESRIEKSIMSKLPAPAPVPMEEDGMSDRVDAVETQVKQLMIRQQQMEKNMTDAASHHGAQIAGLQSQMQVQNQQLSGKIESTQQNIQALFESKFESQMNQIRSLLSKRPRDDGMDNWRCGEGSWIKFLLCVGLLCTLGSAQFGTLLTMTLFPLGCLCLSLAHPEFVLWNFVRSAFRPGGVSKRPTAQVPWICLVLVFSALFQPCGAVRFREASHPGPSAEESSDSSFVLGCFNPSGLGGKASLIHNSLAYADLWSVTETHLSSRAMQSFRSALAFERSAFRCTGGYPAPARAHSSVAGSWKGVAVLSRHPTRKVMPHWQREIEVSSRALVAVSYICQQWVTVGTMYGELESKSYPNHAKHNNALLSAVASQVCFLSRGLRMVCGDWNVLEDSLAAFEVLKSQGFQDLQRIAHSRWATPLVNTCKGVSRRDFCFISPELQALLCAVHVTPDFWPDHAILEGHFRVPCQSFDRRVWNPPDAFPWPSSFVVDEHLWDQSTGDDNARYAQLWKGIEQVASSKSPYPVPAKCWGRGREDFTKAWKNTSVPPPKPSRQGDLQPLFSGLSFRHAQWFKQVRRFESYVRHVKSRPEACNSAHADKVWHSILQARGFAHRFRSWWASHDQRSPGAPDVCPILPPKYDVAAPMLQTMVMALRQFEKELRTSSRQYAMMRRSRNPMAIFQDIKEYDLTGGDMFVQQRQAAVSSIDPDDLCLVLEKPCEWIPGEPIYCQGQPLDWCFDHWPWQHLGFWSPWHSCWSSGLPTDLYGWCRYHAQRICSGLVGSLETPWSCPRVSMASQILQFARDTLPRHSLDWPSLDVASLRRCIRHKKTTTARGLDAVSIADLRCQTRLSVTFAGSMIMPNRQELGLLS